MATCRETRFAFFACRLLECFPSELKIESGFSPMAVNRTACCNLLWGNQERGVASASPD